MAPIPVPVASTEDDLSLSGDNLSVASVTRRINKIFEDYPIDFCSSGETFETMNQPSGNQRNRVFKIRV